MNVSVIVPLQLNDEDIYRANAWRYLKSKWESEHPNYELVIGRNTGTWIKAHAIMDGVRQTTGDLLIIADADIWVPGIHIAIAEAEEFNTWVKPFEFIKRLNVQGTAHVIGGSDIETIGSMSEYHDGPPYPNVPGGAIVIIPKRMLLDVPPDPRFIGWGGIDFAWNYALSTLHQPARQTNLTAYHLWHPPQPRLNPKVGNEYNAFLRGLYGKANGRPEQMRKLIREIRAA